MARIALINGFAPIIAPVLGSQLLHVIEWRGIFWLLAAFGLVISVAALVLIPETLPSAQRKAESDPLGKRVRTVLRDRVFVGVTLVGGMVFAALITYLSTSKLRFNT